MALRRIIYILTWVGCFIFFFAYHGWISWLLLVAVTTLPLFSLMISLPAMLTARLELLLPPTVTQGDVLQLQPQCVCRLPVFFHKCTVIVTHTLTGLQQKQKPRNALPTDHCGALHCAVTRTGVCDYLGLFRIPLRRPQPSQVLVRPKPLPMDQQIHPEQFLSGIWQPKPGGGFAENHELRLYRPGDCVQQIHWKLSAKTGKLILREPMQLRRTPIIVGLELTGTPEELDRKLGRLLWLGTELVDKEIPFAVQCVSSSGIEHWNIDTDTALQQAIDHILTQQPAAEADEMDRPWQFRIGGAENEA